MTVPHPRASISRAAIDDRLRARVLFAAHGVEVVTTEWRRELHPARAEGTTSYAAIEFMRIGAFEKRCGRGRVFADPGTAVFFERDERFEVRHPVGVSNFGTTIRLDESALEAFGAGSTRAIFERPIATTPAAFDFALHRLLGWLERWNDGEIDAALAAEERVFAFARAALAYGRTQETRLLPTAAERARADVMRAHLNEHFALPLKLADIAAIAGCSPWHAAKVFHKATGSTLHATLRRLRLRRALERLRDGAPDLTRLALETGFSSHSHFTSAFRMEFGITPRGARKAFTGSRDW